MTNDVIAETKGNMDKSIAAYQKELGNIRAGVANASLLEGVRVDYYSVPTPLTQMSSVTIPEARVPLVTPYDKSSLDNTKHTLLANDLGLTPANNDNVTRLVAPQLIGKHREKIAKQVDRQVEQARTAVGDVRREVMDSLKRQEENGDITEDEQKHLEKDVQKVTDDVTKRVDQLTDEKHKEITKG